MVLRTLWIYRIVLKMGCIFVLLFFFSFFRIRFIFLLTANGVKMYTVRCEKSENIFDRCLSTFWRFDFRLEIRFHRYVRTRTRGRSTHICFTSIRMLMHIDGTRIYAIRICGMNTLQRALVDWFLLLFFLYCFHCVDLGGSATLWLFIVVAFDFDACLFRPEATFHANLDRGRIKRQKNGIKI